MTYCWKCRYCDTLFEIQRPIAEYGIPPPDNDPEYDCGCPDAETAGRFVRVYEAPMIMQAALPDGHTRPGFRREKEALKLEIAAASAPPKQAAELKKAAAQRRREKE